MGTDTGREEVVGFFRGRIERGDVKHDLIQRSSFGYTGSDVLCMYHGNTAPG